MSVSDHVRGRLGGMRLSSWTLVCWVAILVGHGWRRRVGSVLGGLSVLVVISLLSLMPLSTYLQG